MNITLDEMNYVTSRQLTFRTKNVIKFRDISKLHSLITVLKSGSENDAAD